MGKVAKLHRRLVKKRSEISTYKKAVRALLMILEPYANSSNWQHTGENRDVIEKGIVIGTQPVLKWVGQGSGPELAASILNKVKA